ncbi:MAG: hypothetical protein ACE365_04855 [Gammaproteobacteria bacterium]
MLQWLKRYVRYRTRIHGGWSEASPFRNWSAVCAHFVDESPEKQGDD